MPLGAEGVRKGKNSHSNNASLKSSLRLFPIDPILDLEIRNVGEVLHVVRDEGHFVS